MAKVIDPLAPFEPLDNPNWVFDDNFPLVNITSAPLKGSAPSQCNDFDVYPAIFVSDVGLHGPVIAVTSASVIPTISMLYLSNVKPDLVAVVGGAELVVDEELVVLVGAMVVVDEVVAALVVVGALVVVAELVVVDALLLLEHAAAAKKNTTSTNGQRSRRRMQAKLVERRMTISSERGARFE